MVKFNLKKTLLLLLATKKSGNLWKACAHTHT